MADSLDGMRAFIAVAEARSFRGAGDRLGVTSSAISQTVRKLEERLGVALVRRTTRSVHLTEIGERLYAQARPALEQLAMALADVGELSAEPRGTLRLHVARAAESFLTGPLLAGFLAAERHVQLHLELSDAPVDIVAEGFDAGVQLNELIDMDMIAVPLSGDLRLVVVGSPAYFARRPKPKHPRELAEHECLNCLAGPGGTPYRWEFTDADGREFSVAVPARVVSSDQMINVRLAREGIGLTLVSEDYARESMARGELLPVLEEYSASFPGYYLFYPRQHNQSAALRAFVEYLHRVRRTPNR